MSDRLDFSIEGVKNMVQEMGESNTQNKNNKEAFLDYIKNDLAPEWNTKEGQVAVNDLINFVNTRYQEYISYLDAKIDALDSVVVPALERIDNA